MRQIVNYVILIKKIYLQFFFLMIKEITSAVKNMTEPMKQGVVKMLSVATPEQEILSPCALK